MGAPCSILHCNLDVGRHQLLRRIMHYADSVQDSPQVRTLSSISVLWSRVWFIDIPGYMRTLFGAIVLAAITSTGAIKAQWVPIESGTINNLASVSLLPTSTGYSGIAVGKEVALRTTDKGQTWVHIELPTGQPLESVTFAPNGTAWIIGRDGAVLYSHDTGQSWEHHKISTASDILEQRAITFVDSSIGFITGVRRFLRTTDGGLTWDSIAQGPVGDLRSVSFPSKDVGYSVGWNRIYTSYDAGISWSNITPKEYISILSYCHFFTPRHGIVIGWGNGLIIKTYNGGETWVRRDVLGSYPHTWGCFVNDSVGYIATDYYGIIKTMDQGENWTHYELPPPVRSSMTTRRSNAWGLDFIDENNGIAVGANGVIYRTENGGGVPSHVFANTVFRDSIYCELRDGAIQIRGDDGRLAASMYDMCGRQTVQEHITSGRIALPLSLAGGIYCLILRAESGEVTTHKILIP